MSHSDDFDVLLTSVLQHTAYVPNGRSAKTLRICQGKPGFLEAGAAHLLIGDIESGLSAVLSGHPTCARFPETCKEYSTSNDPGERKQKKQDNEDPQVWREAN